MGTWSAALFGSDTALDVRDEYIGYLKQGKSNSFATREIIKAFSDELEDQDEATVVWCALAATQWKYGRLQARVKNKALQHIKRGGDLESWALDAPELVATRKRVLNSLNKKLESKQPAEKRIRIVKPQVVKKSKSKSNPWKPGQVVAYRSPKSGMLYLLLTEGVRTDYNFGVCPCFIVLDWRGKKLPTEKRLKSIKPAYSVIEVYENKKGEPVPWDDLELLKTTRSLSGKVHINKHGMGCDYGIEECHWCEIEADLELAFDAETRKYKRQI